MQEIEALAQARSEQLARLERVLDARESGLATAEQKLEQARAEFELYVEGMKQQLQQELGRLKGDTPVPPPGAGAAQAPAVRVCASVGVYVYATVPVYGTCREQ